MSVRRTVTINGEDLDLELEPGTTLLELIRSDGLTGAKEACGRGECGACTVLVGDRTVNACTTLAVRLNEPIRTVEGIAEEATALRRNLAEHGGLQCGFCTPGMVVRAHWIVRNHPGPWTPELVRSLLAGNICRCTGYQGIVEAILETHAATAATEAQGSGTAAEATGR